MATPMFEDTRSFEEDQLLDHQMRFFKEAAERAKLECDYYKEMIKLNKQLPSLVEDTPSLEAVSRAIHFLDNEMQFLGDEIRFLKETVRRGILECAKIKEEEEEKMKLNNKQQLPHFLDNNTVESLS